MLLKIAQNDETIGIFGDDLAELTTLRVDVTADPQTVAMTIRSHRNIKDDAQTFTSWDVGEIDGEVSFSVVQSGDPNPPTSLIEWRRGDAQNVDGYVANMYVKILRGLRKLREIGERPPSVQSIKTTDSLSCSFCGRDQLSVRTLVAGPSVFICDECVVLCSEIVLGGFEKPAT